MLAVGQVAAVHGHVFAAPFAGTYHAPRGTDAGWVDIPYGTRYASCAAHRLPAGNMPGGDGSVLVCAVPRKGGTAGGGHYEGQYVARPYTLAAVHMPAPRL